MRTRPKTASAKSRFILATDGANLEAEETDPGDSLACAHGAIARHFGFFPPLAGISVVKEIRNNAIDVKPTGRLNKLYVELLRSIPVVRCRGQRWRR